MHTLSSAVSRIESINCELQSLRDAFALSEGKLLSERNTLAAYTAQAKDGLDIQMIQTAKKHLDIDGLYSKGGAERASVLMDAINEVAKGGGRLLSEYFGTKSYDRWYGQRCDCDYGRYPSHGHIIFSIGLKFRKEPIPNGDRDACVYYLLNLDKIQSVALES